MPAYIALLRAINVGGTAALKMAALKDCLSGLGFDPVTTYLQSGNVVFGAPKTAPGNLSATIEKRLSRDFGIAPAVMVIAANAWHEVLSENPFLRESDVDPKTLHVSFLFDLPSSEGLKRLAAVKRGPDRYELRDRRVYLNCPKGYGTSKLANPNLERALQVQATTRNWNTVSALADIASG